MRLPVRERNRERSIRSVEMAGHIPQEERKNPLAEHLGTEAYAILESGLESTMPAKTFLSAFIILEPFLPAETLVALRADLERQQSIKEYLENYISSDMGPIMVGDGYEPIIHTPLAETFGVVEMCIRFNPELVNNPSYQRYQREEVPGKGKELVDHFIWFLTHPQPYREYNDRLFNTRILFELAPTYQASVLSIIRQPQLQTKIREFLANEKSLRKLACCAADALLIAPELAQTAQQAVKDHLPEVVKEIETILLDKKLEGLVELTRYLEAVAILTARRAVIDGQGRLTITPVVPLQEPRTPLPDREGV